MKPKHKKAEIKIPADATDKEVMEMVKHKLKEFRTDAKLAKGQIVMNTEDKEP
jgi:hypothetical protein